MTPAEWNDIIVQDLQGHLPEQKICLTIAEVPSLLRRGRKSKLYGIPDDTLVDELLQRLDELRPMLNKFRTRLNDFESTPFEPGLTHIYFQRIYGLALMPILVLHVMLQGLYATDDQLDEEIESLVKETIVLADKSHIYRPFGASYIVLCLVLALSASHNPDDRDTALLQLQEYCCDFPALRRVWRNQALHRVTQHLRMDESYPVSAFC